MLALVGIRAVLPRGPLRFRVVGTSGRLSSCSPVLNTEHWEDTVLIHLSA